MIIENPAGPNGYITSGQNFLKPTFIDRDRSIRGDVFKKPTAYWFIGCEPTYGMTESRKKKIMTIDRARPSGVAGLCSEERSMIHPDYARAFICDFIIGKTINGSQLSIF